MTCGSTPVHLVSENLGTFNGSQLDARIGRISTVTGAVTPSVSIGGPGERLASRCRMDEEGAAAHHLIGVEPRVFVGDQQTILACQKCRRQFLACQIRHIVMPHF